MRYTVLGIGRQGLAATYDLVRHCDTTELIAVDVRFADTTVLEAVRKHLSRLLGADEQRIRYLDLNPTAADGRDRLEKIIAGCDCLVSALPYQFNLAATRLAISAGVPICDMGGNPAMVEEQRALAQQHGHVVVPECGLAPGLINVLIKHMVQEHGAQMIRAFCGGLPHPKPDPAVNPLQYKLVFSPAGLISEYMGACPVLIDGVVSYEPALSGLEKLDDDYEAFYTSNNSPRILEYLATIGVHDYVYKTLRYHGHLEKVLTLKSIGFLAGDGNADSALQERLADSAALHFDRRHDRDKVIVVISGTSGGQAVPGARLQQHMDANAGFTAMELTTSWGTTIVAHALAAGVSRPAGFATPEQFIDTSWFIDQLKRRTDNLLIK